MRMYGKSTVAEPPSTPPNSSCSEFSSYLMIDDVRMNSDVTTTQQLNINKYHVRYAALFYSTLTTKIIPRSGLLMGWLMARCF